MEHAECSNGRPGSPPVWTRHNRTVIPLPRLRPITEADRPAVERLWQLYKHDLSESRGSQPDDVGLFKPGRLPGYFDDPDKAGVLITYNDALAGFAFIDGLLHEPKMIGDFFVVRAVRRHGVGFQVATELIPRYPGHWEIGFQANNARVPEFWRRVVTHLVGTNWREETRPVPDKPHIPHDHFIVFDVKS